MAFPSSNSIALLPDNAYAGQIAEAGMPRACRSARVEGANVFAGTPVKRGTAGESQVAAYVGGDTVNMATFAGVVLLSTSRSLNEINTDLDAGADVEIMRLGCVYMNFAGAVTSGQNVKITLATGALEGSAEGASAGTVGAGKVVLPGLRVVQTTSGAGLARVEVNLFGVQTAATIGA